jgi:parvulin-like peptidyl-prolyl isomerase
MFGLDPSSDPQISQTLNQITDELNTPSTLGLQIIDDMVNDLLIRQYAKKNGITVTAADVEKAAQEALQYYQNGTPTPTPSPTAIVYPTLDATQLALVSPTPASRASPTRTPDLAENGTLGTSLTPTGTPYTLSGYQTQYQRALDTYIALGINEATFRKIFFESALYRQRVSDIVTANVGHVQEQVWARNILVPDEGTAESILKQLQAGANFASLADQYSTNPNTNKGGDLGWFGKGTMDDAIEKAAFALQVGEISQPVKTVSGWEIIQVLGHESRALTETEYTTVVAAAFTQWLATQRSASNVTTSSNWANNVPNQPSLQNALDELYGTPTATSNQAP